MKSILKFLVAIVMPLAFVACSDDDEPKSDTSAVEEYNRLMGYINGGTGNFVYIKSETDKSICGLAVNDAAESKSFCELILNAPWDGQRITKTLSDGYGSFTITPSEEAGVYHVIAFNLKDIRRFSLYIATEEWFNNDNFSHRSSGNTML